MNIRGEGAAELQCGGFACAMARAPAALHSARVVHSRELREVARGVGKPELGAGKAAAAQRTLTARRAARLGELT